MNGETKCARFLGSPGPAEPEKTWHICSCPLCTTATARPHVPEWGEPRDRPRPQSKNAFFTKRIYHSKSGPDFSISARSLLLPTPNERRDQMCQVFGLARARGARKPGTFAPSLPAPQQRQGQTCRNGGNPGDRPRPQSKTHFFTKRIYHSKSGPDFSILPAPSSSLHPMNGETKCARFLGSPARGARKPGTFAPSLPAPQQRQGQMCRNSGTPRSARPQSKTHFLRKEFITQNLALIFSIFARSLLLLQPVNGET